MISWHLTYPQLSSHPSSHFALSLLMWEESLAPSALEQPWHGSFTGTVELPSTYPPPLNAANFLKSRQNRYLLGFMWLPRKGRFSNIYRRFSPVRPESGGTGPRGQGDRTVHLQTFCDLRKKPIFSAVFLLTEDAFAGTRRQSRLSF